jgi:hypothetical protein
MADDRDEQFRDPLTMSDEHVNHMRRFAGLPPMDAEEMARWRGYLRWMRSRFGQRPNDDKPPQT